MKNFPLAILTLPVRGTDNIKLGQLYACCCPAFQHHQVISSHNINSLWADCFKEIWLCICISYHSSTLKWHIYLKSFHRDATACLCEIIMALVLGWGWGWGWVSSGSGSGFIPNRIQQYNAVCMSNIINSRVIIDIVMWFCWWPPEKL